MKTLVIVSHPDVENSGVQQFLKASIEPLDSVDWYHLETVVTKWNTEFEQNQLRQYDRLIFQFPMYWYSTPYIFKQWLDVVMTSSLYKEGLKGKELGIVVSLGVCEKEFQAGGKEGFTLSEIYRPFEALANKCGMTYLPIFSISQFVYQTENQKKALLVEYQQYVTMPNNATFKEKENWFMKQLSNRFLKNDSDGKIGLLLNQLEENRQELDDLLLAIEEMREADE